MNWRLTQAAIDKPAIDDWRDEDHEEDLAVGYSYLRALAESGFTLVEIAPGIWRHSRTPEDPQAYWVPKTP